MPRAMSSAMQAALSGALLDAAVFVEIGFTTGPVYLWSGANSIVWDGKTWVGVGTLGSISEIDEGATVEARGIMLSLSGINAEMLAAVLEDFQVGAPVKVHLGLFNAGSLVVDPVNSWSGHMDQPVINLGAETATISIACENRLVELNNAVDRRLTNDDQQRDYPGDLGLSFVNAIQDRPFYWGQKASTT